jgi:hypothetical protein
MSSLLTDSSDHEVHHIPRVPQCLSSRPNWDPPPTPSHTNKCITPSQRKGKHSPAGEVVGSQFGRLDKKPALLGGILIRLPVTSPDLGSVFIEATRTFNSFFLIMQKNSKTIGAYTESTDLNFKALKKNNSFRDTVPLILSLFTIHT